MKIIPLAVRALPIICTASCKESLAFKTVACDIAESLCASRHHNDRQQWMQRCTVTHLGPGDHVDKHEICANHDQRRQRPRTAKNTSAARATSGSCRAINMLSSFNDVYGYH